MQHKEPWQGKLYEVVCRDVDLRRNANFFYYSYASIYNLYDNMSFSEAISSFSESFDASSQAFISLSTSIIT